MRKQIIFITGAVVVVLGIGFLFWLATQSFSRAVKALNTLPQTTSAVTKAQPTIPVTTPAGAQRQFYNMNVKNRTLLLNEINKKDLSTIFRSWLEAGRVEHDAMKQQAIGFILSRALRSKSPSGEVYDQFQRFIADNSNSVHERSDLLHILGEAETKASLDQLIQDATMMTDMGLKQTAIREIGSIDALWGDGQFHEELSPALERVWQESNDQYLLTSVAMAMAKVGAPRGIQLLFASALPDGDQSGVRKRIAQSALPEVLNPDAVPVLSGFLANGPPTSPASKLASATLAEMSAPAAAQALLSWVQTADASAAPFAQNYVVQTRSPAMLQTFEAALNPAVPFRSEENRAAIRAGLTQHKANRKFLK